MDEKKRAPKCSGCGWKHSDHSFGQVGPYCAGPEKEQHDNLIDDDLPMIKTQVEPAVKFRPREQGETNEKKMSDQLENSGDSDDEDHIIALLQERLQNLSIHEEKIRKQRIIEELRYKITVKEQNLEELERSKIPVDSQRRSVLFAPGFGGISGAQALTNKELKKLIPEKINTPLDELLQSQEDGNVEVTGAGRRWNQSRTVRTNLGIPTRENQVQSLGLPLEVCGEASAEPNFIPNIPDQADLFLAPMNNKGIFKALLIPDFVSKIVPDVDESVINLGPRAKLSVSYGLQKPKLSDITLSEFNVANTRILYRLIETGQLSSHSDIKAYLCYTVKINELTAKFRWQNVLKYDEEFRQLQAKHSLPWTLTTIIYTLNC